MNRASAPGYDLFKLAVTILLVVILLLMLLRGCAAPAAQTAVENTPVSEPTENLAPASAPVTDAPEDDTPTPAPSATSTSAPAKATPTSAPLSETVTPMPEAAAAKPETPITTPAATKVAGGTPTGAESNACNTRVPSRLNVGQTALVVQRLNMRTNSSITAPTILTSPVNTQVEIIGGPVCQPVAKRAYLWWQIRLPGGEEGWSAESPLNEATYFLEPIP